ncbi:glycosyl hydrolase family 61-domain-containing protein [Chaetomidium leptoderma]|uniref:lytic cellulose monooxygenase (C4-dehydrogenating) n=1 Tax=Chaetomidium leptoderma TaxID=669021 RepID=A0AAN6VI32_9PEZI|nr:glycosyl hydrolase family 61-domain-containing protein [Chaetomidium leptoderma]
MPSLTSKTLLSALAGAASVAAHGHVQHLIINGLQYQGYDPFSFPYMQDAPTVVGWTASNTDNGFVAPDAFASGDIICHKTASNAGGHAVVAAGDKIFIQWDTWPESHHGPVIDYLANCGAEGCEKVSKTALEFFKIGEVGLVDGANAPGIWGSDQLIANNNAWMVQIPSNIAPGNYVLRHEIIALHSGNQANGAQNYPQCFNLEVTGSGTDTPAGVAGTSLYTPTDAGILANIYTSPVKYEIPGPALISGASSIAQGSSAATATASAVTGSASAPPAATTTTTTNAPAASATTSVDSGATLVPAPSESSSTAAPVASSSAAAPRPTGCSGGSARRRHARDLSSN